MNRGPLETANFVSWIVSFSYIILAFDVESKSHSRNAASAHRHTLAF